jgi:HPt (histidine-containing phosphotransfer) domain-containing protein
MDAYVSKPIRMVELNSALATVLPSACHASEHANQERPFDDAEPPAAGTASTREPGERLSHVLDRQALLQRFGGREDRLRTVIRIFQDEAKSLMGNLRAAIAAGDAGRLGHAAHSLKGAVGVFGATEAADAAFALESIAETGELTGALKAFECLDEEVCRLTSVLALLAGADPAGA